MHTKIHVVTSVTFMIMYDDISANISLLTSYFFFFNPDPQVDCEFIAKTALILVAYIITNLIPFFKKYTLVFPLLQELDKEQRYCISGKY